MYIYVQENWILSTCIHESYIKKLSTLSGTWEVGWSRVFSQYVGTNWCFFDEWRTGDSQCAHITLESVVSCEQAKSRHYLQDTVNTVRTLTRNISEKHSLCLQSPAKHHNGSFIWGQNRVAIETKLKVEASKAAYFIRSDGECCRWGYYAQVHAHLLWFVLSNNKTIYI